jgi:hypothetical protein
MAILLNIRLLQARRELHATGPGVVIVFGILLVLIFASYTTFQKSPDAYYLTAFLFLMCVSLQSYRNDKIFVYSHIRKPRLEIYSEYVVLTFPFAVSSLFTHNWFCYPLLLTALLRVPFIRFTIEKKTYLKHISAIIPASDFEWISGLRKSFVFLIPVYALALGMSWFRVLPLILLWFITVSVASFYSECEPKHILQEGNLSSKQLLNRKLYRSSRYLILLYLPVLFINTLFNPDYWVLGLLFIPMQVALVSYSVCLKYASYEPNKKPIGNSIILALVSLGSIVPYFVPVPLMMAIYTYGKAKKNLNNYLDD